MVCIRIFVFDRPYKFRLTCGDRTHTRLGAFRKGFFGLCQAFIYLSAGEVDIYFVLENYRNLREAIA